MTNRTPSPLPIPDGDHVQEPDPDRLLVCLLPSGVGREIQGRLFSELGLVRVDLHAARGFMGADPGGLFNRVEREVVSAVVPADRAEEVFSWLYREGKVAEAEGRFLYQLPVERATPFLLPAEIPVEGPSR